MTAYMMIAMTFPIAELISLTVSLIFFIRINKTIISKIPDGSDIL